MVSGVELLVDEVEACRTCGIFYLNTSNILSPLFSNEVGVDLIRKQLALWKIEYNGNDGLPQYICKVCAHEFENLIRFRQACEETHQQWRQWKQLQAENQLKFEIKTEKSDDPGETCTFIYVDDDTNDVDNNYTPIRPKLKEEPEDSKESLQDILNRPIKEEKTNNKATVLALAEQSAFRNIKIETERNIGEGDIDIAQREIGGTVNLQCKSCLFVTDDQQKLRQHMVRIHEAKNIQCPTCNRQFRDAIQLKYHIKWHRLHRHAKCMQCGFYCSSKEILKEHQQAVHRKIPCSICAKPILPKKLKRHLLMHETKETFTEEVQCIHCLSRFHTEVELEQHNKTFHRLNDPSSHSSIPQDEGQSSVPAFDYYQYEEKKLVEDRTTHPTISSQSNSYVSSLGNDADDDDCLIMEETVKYEYTIEDSNSSSAAEECIPNSGDATINAEFYADENAESTADDSICTQTDEGATENSWPSDDEMSDETFQCSQCENAFNTIEDLKTHFSLIHEENNYSCNSCGKNFVLQFRLKQHLKKCKNV